MIFLTSGVVIGISFITGSLIGMFIGNQVTRRTIRNERAEEFEYWIGTFEDEGSDLGITNVTPDHSGFAVVPVRY
jgi:hypothetical protein